MKVELTSNYGWKPGERCLKQGERVLALLHVEGRIPVVVGEGKLAYSVFNTLLAAGAEKIE